MDNNLWLWVGFNLFVLMMLALDLGVFHRHSHEVKFKEALGWSAAWISLALVFNALIYFQWHRLAPDSSYTNSGAAIAFFTGYLIEKALSVDNIFVFLMIFSLLQVPAKYQHKVLFWGIIGALLMRAACIAAGITLLKNFHWLIYVFGAFLIFTGIKMALHKDKKGDGENKILRAFRRVVPMTEEFHGDKFWIRENGKKLATPLFAALVLIEFSDLVFAVDSIPAILAITREPFLVYTSNVFAILGLRSLYFALAGLVGLFHYLHLGLSAVLVFVGAKMMLVDFYKIPPLISLAIIAAMLAIAVIASIRKPPSDHTPETAPPETV